MAHDNTFKYIYVFYIFYLFLWKCEKENGSFDDGHTTITYCFSPFHSFRCCIYFFCYKQKSKYLISQFIDYDLRTKLI